jgi:transposase
METKYSQAITQRVEELQSLQKSQSKVVVYQRLQLLRLLKECQAKTLTEASTLVGVSKRSGLRWWKQYKQEGFESLLVVAPTRQPRLSKQQQQELLAEAARGEFSTIAEILHWVEQSFGISYTEVGMWKLVRRLKIKKKTPRPSHVKKDQWAIERFKKTSLS